MRVQIAALALGLAVTASGAAFERSSPQPLANQAQDQAHTQPSSQPLLPALPAAGSSATAPTIPAVAMRPESRLAIELTRNALQAAALTPLTTEALELAVLLAEEAVALEPDSVEIWRIVRDLAILAEREDLRATALERLSRLDPNDENVRLQRLNLALERYQTLPERVAAYETLLAEDNIPRLGEVTASRLAMDLALIKQRAGDTDGFSRWLARSLQLDRANRTAAAIATGFYRANVTDPVGEAELLVNLFMADPTAIQTQIDLASLLLEHGAYNGAYRMYSLAAGGIMANRNVPSSALLADMAIAQWASGDAEAALVTIIRRQAEIDEAYRQERARADQRLTRADLAQMKGLVEPTLAGIAAVIKAGRGDRDAHEALDQAIAAHEAVIEQMKKANPPVAPAAIAAKYLEAAWLALWLGQDGAKPLALVQAAEQLQPLSDAARARFEGWRALKEGEIDRAIEVLTPLAQDDAAARVGLALALMQAGRNKDAARELLALNQSQPGSMIGIWAAGELTRIVGQRVPLSKHASDLERLIASIPQTLDRYVREGSLVVGLRVIPENPNPGPYDPIRIRVELTNNSILPLALDPAGPLRPQVLVIPSLSTSIPLPRAPQPFVVDLGTRLRLAPRESVSVTFDIRAHSIASLLNTSAVTGGLLKFTVLTNFVATLAGSIEPGLYGVEIEAPLLRIDGVRRNEQWLERAVAMMNDPNAEPATLVVNMGLALNEAVLAVLERRPMTQERQRLLQNTLATMPDAFARLDGASQAWLLTLMPRQVRVPALLTMARKSDSRLVKIVYLLYHRTGPDDPMLDAARRGEDAALKHLANLLSDSPAAAFDASADAAGETEEAPGAVPGVPSTTQPALPPTTDPTTSPATMPSIAIPPAATSATTQPD